ncbi:ATP-binding protein [Streptomyces sp. NPDC018833]|uniref:ATP-binding protein n=1 Tax=Streptomyces sp. NPDC018833 TaxID=3365053 RepID=UPI0037B330EB
MTYRYLVLGTAQALRPDGTAAPLSGARLRALLAALAAAAGRAVSPGELAAQVWGDAADPPADEHAALQALVGRLRRTLGRDAVVSEPGGYRLAASRDAVDLFRFERLVAQGTAALDAGDPATAAAVLDEALGLWRGPALADLPGRDTDPLVVRADRWHADARRHRLGAHVAAGRPAAALAELTALCAETPLDEPLHALLVRALRAAGRPAEALQTYEDLRVRLADRLGTDPGGELRALHAELLAAADVPRTPDPGPAARGNLRARLTSFVGRERELAELAAALDRHRLVTLLGPGGAGKTRLAVEAASAADSPGTWPDGVWVAELASLRDEETVPEAVLTALGARRTHLRGPADAVSRDAFAQLLEHCSGRRMLLVLDNCEHLIGAAARLSDALLARCPGVRVLATSREPLGVPGETVHTVGPLPDDVALRLLGDRGAAARAGFTVDDDPAACAEICRRLDGLPLGVELAAARLRALTPRQIADRLDDRFRLLTGGSRTLLPRQQTLRAVVDWSWDLLTEDERTVLRRLTVFSGGCTLDLAEEVCGAGALEPLASLVDKSLVTAAPAGPDGMRYGLLETVGEYAAERLDEARERTAVERRHLHACRELARRADVELRGPGQAVWLERLESEHDNVRAALRTATTRGEEQDALCLALSMSWFWQQRGHQTDARTWAPAAAALGPDPFTATPPRPAAALRQRVTAEPPPWSDDVLWEARRGVRLMVLATRDSDGSELSDPRTQEYLRAVVAAYRPELPQVCRQPGSMWYFARLMRGEFTGLDDTLAAMVADCAATHARLRHDPPAAGAPDRNRAWDLAWDRDLDRGRDPGTDRNRDRDRNRDPDLDRDLDWDLGFALLLRAKLLGDTPGGDGPGDADRALALFESVGDRWGIAESLSARGEGLERSARYAEAAADFARAMTAAAEVGAYAQVPVLAARLAAARLRIATCPAERDRAERQLLDAVRRSSEFAPETMSAARMLLVQHYGRTGRAPLAREHLHRIGEELKDANAALFAGAIEGAHAWLDCLGGDHAAAAARAADAVRLMNRLALLAAPHLIADQFLCAAWAFGHVGRSHDGARLLGAYDRHGKVAGGLGFRPFADEREVRQRAEEGLRELLGTRAYASAYASGGGLSVREAAGLILQPPGGAG